MLKGIIAPDGKELDWNSYLSIDENWAYPKAIRCALFESLNRQRTRWISVTTLLYCLRKAKLEFERDYYLKQEDAYYFMRGNLLHGILASVAGEDALVEFELSYKFPGTDIVLGGQLDLWENGILDDYKTMADTGIHILKREGIKEEYRWQTNIYKYLLKKIKNLDTKEVRIIFLMMSKCIVSGRNFRIFNQKKQIDDIFTMEKCPMYSDDKIESFLVPKIKLLDAGHNPPANPQAWLCKSCYFKNECKEMIGKGSAEVKTIDREKTSGGELF